jgi:AcrR family transcriptional regulator
MAIPATKKRAYHHGDLARALVEAALEKIEREGVEAFTLREAARAVGVTHAAAYRHFEDKRAVLAAIAQEGFRALSEELDAQVEGTREKGGDAVAQVAAIGCAYVRYALREPARFRVMFGPRLNEDGRFPELEQQASRAFRRLLAVIEAGQRVGTIRDGKPIALAGALWSTAHGFASLVMHRRIQVKSATRAESFFLEIADPMIAGLRRIP